VTAAVDKIHLLHPSDTEVAAAPQIHITGNVLEETTAAHIVIGHRVAIPTPRQRAIALATAPTTAENPRLIATIAPTGAPLHLNPIVLDQDDVLYLDPPHVLMTQCAVRKEISRAVDGIDLTILVTLSPLLLKVDNLLSRHPRQVLVILGLALVWTLETAIAIIHLDLHEGTVTGGRQNRHQIRRIL
jgi:hypothetical protein